MPLSESALPDELQGLVELALDLRWAWRHDLDDIWRRINPSLWAASRNPRAVLHSAGRATLDALANDPAFVSVVQACLAEHRAFAAAPAWFQKTHPDAIRTIAYFSMEFGISEALPIYAGGLGVLAGDYLKASSDLGVPVVGVGLLYQRGYFRQVIDANGAQVEFYPSVDSGDLPIVPVRDNEGAQLRLSIPFPGRSVYARAWRAEVGRVSLYLLDTNDPENGPADRGITAELYGGDPEVRLRQELVLGIAGWRLLDALGIPVEICHLNEGHAAFAVLERAHALMKAQNVPFDVALAAARPGNMFTTHTAVAAGFDVFEPRLIERYLRPYAHEVGIALETILALGRDPSRGAFMPAHLAVRTSGTVNGVSRRHGEVSRRLFGPLFPGWPTDEVPVGYVTNGVHTPSWGSVESDRIWTQACGENRWRDDLGQVDERIRAVSNGDLWQMRVRNRTRLVEYVRGRSAQQLREAGAMTDRVAAASHFLDPGILTLGFARRFAPYKRPILLLQDPQRLVRLLTDANRPIQLIVAGKAHPHDTEGKAKIQAWATFVRRREIEHRVVFLADYDMEVAEELVQGVDLWLNTPLPPWEASGTSGMKVLVNGGLNLSALDGWWYEAYEPRFGWTVGSGSEDEPDAAAAQALYDRLEREIVPEFYTRDADGIPAAWVQRVRESMAELAPRFSANRMVRQYVEGSYVPAASALRRRMAAGCALAYDLVGWQRSVKETWPGLHFGEPFIRENGATYEYEVRCSLGRIEPANVAVELYADGSHVERHPMKHGPIEADGSTVYRAVIQTKRNIGDFTPRAVPHRPEAIVPLEAAEITWQR